MLKIWIRCVAHKAIGIFGATATLALSVACSNTPDSQPAGPAEASKQIVDLVFHNGHVLTIDEAFNVHEVLVVHDGKVITSGTRELLETYEGESNA